MLGLGLHEACGPSGSKCGVAGKAGTGGFTYGGDLDVEVAGAKLPASPHATGQRNRLYDQAYCIGSE